jgi:hypothetical protein
MKGSLIEFFHFKIKISQSVMCYKVIRFIIEDFFIFNHRLVKALRFDELTGPAGGIKPGTEVHDVICKPAKENNGDG